MNKKQSIKFNKKLKRYAEEHYNVLLSGKHGIGKTEVIKEIFSDTFGELNKDWLYFSASTMDPWIDFIGIPKNYKNSQGKEVFKVIPPENFDNSEVTAIYFDEFNRSDEKIRNAVMELIQFKSINGRKFKNLKCIWAAINPFDEEEVLYQVEEIDPAQLDRFQIQIEVPYEVNSHFFENKYGDLGTAACQWWDNLSSEHKDLISPRRLDYAVDVWKKGLDVQDVFSKYINSKSFIETLNVVEGKSYLIKLFKENDKKLLKSYLTLNRIQNLLPVFDSNIDLLKFSIVFFPKDYLLSLLDSKYTNIKNYILSNIDSKKIEPFACTSIFLSLMYFKKIKESQVKENYSFYNEANNFMINVKQLPQNFKLTDVCNIFNFNSNHFYSNDFVFNVVFQLYLLEKKPLLQYVDFFNSLSLRLMNNPDLFNDRNIKSKTMLFIFILKLTYLYNYISETHNAFGFQIESLKNISLQILGLSNNNFEVFNRIDGLNSISNELYTKPDKNLLSLPFILDLKYKK